MTTPHVVHDDTGTQHVRWAWIVTALTPVGWLAAIPLGFAGGGVPILGLVSVLLFVAAPTAGLILALSALRAGHHTSRVTAIVAGALTVLTLVMLPVIGMGLIGTVLAVVLVVGALGAFGMLERRTASPKN